MNNIKKPGSLSAEDCEALILEHKGWAESIARSVARNWNMDWKLDGLDGAALEALIFCARRFEPERGVPFRGYARKRIHEASTDAARKSRGWTIRPSKEDHRAREISAELFNLFPDLREGRLPSSDDGDSGGGDDIRSAARQLLIGATIIAAKQDLSSAMPDDVTEYKRMIEIIASLEPVHQLLLWKVYWEGNSMRHVADEWEIDELNIIREHKALLAFLQKRFATTRGNDAQRGQPLKVRPGLKGISIKLKRKSEQGEFSRLLSKAAASYR